MSKKKSVCLPEYVAKIVEQKIQKVSGGNFSSYVNMLIYNDNRSEIDKEAEEIEKRKPERIQDTEMSARKDSTCPVCRKKILTGQTICNSRFMDGHTQYVHIKCCKN